MTRTSSILVLVLAFFGTAVAAAPAAAPDPYPYQSLNAIIGEQGQPASSEYNSMNALIGADSGDRSPANSRDTDPSSVNAILGPDGSPQQSPQPVEADRFDWFDALIGALIASGLTVMTLASVRTVARHRRATAESRA
jgi:hypothetical protein